MIRKRNSVSAEPYRRNATSELNDLCGCIYEGLQISSALQNNAWHANPTRQGSRSGFASKVGAPLYMGNLYDPLLSKREITEMPLTPPRTPPEPPHASNSDTETRVSLGEAALTENTTSHISTPNNVSLITIRHKELPYSQLITLTTPSLHL
jgi:hypothetical protein